MYILMICGIANPKPLIEALKTCTSTLEIMIFSDHHIFNTDDLKSIKKKFQKIEAKNKLILTTEKDGVRLTKFESELRDFPVFLFPMRHKILFGEEDKFSRLIHAFISSFQK